MLKQEQKPSFPSTHTDTFGATTHYTTDKADNLIAISSPNNRQIHYSYEARTQTITYPNGLQEHYSFDEAKELTSLHTAHTTQHYQRDALGRITKLQENLAQGEAQTHLYSYDALGRLTQATPSTGSGTVFSYDKAGNNLHNQSIYNSKNNQLLEDATYTYTYDGRGNLKGKLHKQTKAYTYYVFNAFNQLTKVYTVNEKDEITHYLKYEYDAFNRRISKEENTVKHYYLYHNQNIIAILDKDKNQLATIVHHPSRTDTPLSISNINGTFYYHRDHQGSIIALSNEVGEIVEQITYDKTYGTILSHTIQEENLTLNPYGYTGRETDAQDLYYYRARYYDPMTQRFLSKDPIGFQAGDYNFYRYVSNDPVNFVDPSGLESSAGGHGAGRVYAGNSDFLNGVSKGTKDIVDALVGLPKGIWSYYNHLLNATGYTDMVKGHELPICKCQAQLEEKAIIYAIKEHPDKVANVIWKDIKKRPNYYITGLLISPASAIGKVSTIGKAAAQSATAAKIEGGVIDSMNSKVNNFTGCY